MVLYYIMIYYILLYYIVLHYIMLYMIPGGAEAARWRTRRTGCARSAIIFYTIL